MKLILNGEPKEVPDPLTLQQLLDQLGILAGGVACEVNLRIIKREFYEQTSLRHGDQVEIIQAIGGG
jgi:thiamine biosynthesis protein ThiS